VALALPVSTVERVTDQLLSAGRVRRGFLGLAAQPVQLPDPLRSRLGLTGRVGLVVVNLESEGPAEQGGLLLGDIIVALEGHEVGDPSDLLAALGPEQVGQATAVQLVRGGEIRTVSVTVGERPARRGR
jgi:S1-C subfamily serine protease